MNAANNNGFLPLMLAIDLGHKEIATSLRNVGEDKNYKNSRIEWRKVQFIAEIFIV